MSDGMTVIERYSVSINSTNLRDESDKFSQTDILKAVAWSESEVGKALIRLRAEFDGVEKPRMLSHDELVKLVLAQHSDKENAKDRQKEKELKAEIEAKKWLRNEKTLFFNKLKTLPKCIDIVAVMCERSRLQNPRHVAASLVHYWLDQLCKVCGGKKAAVIDGTPALSGKQCVRCSANGEATGFAIPPYGESGKKILNDMDRFVNRAKSEAQGKMR